jgi:hypothetical protein
MWPLVEIVKDILANKVELVESFGSSDKLIHQSLVNMHKCTTLVAVLHIHHAIYLTYCCCIACTHLCFKSETRTLVGVKQRGYGKMVGEIKH